MSNSQTHNYNLPFDLSNHSDPAIREMAARQNKIWGSTRALGNTLYGNSSSNNAQKSGSSDSKTAGSNGVYMVHCYYGCQPGNKVTTVIG